LLIELKNQYEIVDDHSIDSDLDQMIAEITEKLEAGYNKLIGFETTTIGYEWFGQAPGHEALTSYGLG